ncbi:DUF6092 family protein [Kitasatospora sp. NPDC059571]|uniref:DUF6092 family protein n=1 Tax=Kitasatospora sp. NPDC059571 TaxID=3346871 RepID=UPI00368D1AE2
MPPLVLDQDDAVELLSYLVTAARTQVDEAAEYAPLRLLTAAGRLAAMVGPHAGPELHPLLHEITTGLAETSVAAGDPAAYVARIDAMCRAIAEHLVAALGLDGASAG